MRIVVDTNKCAAHGRCFAVAGAVYDVDDDGFNAMDQTDVPPGLELVARDGAQSCPEQAITLIEG